MTRPVDLCRDPLHLLALGLGSGLSPRAPGTAGSLLALALYFLLLAGLSPLAYLLVVMLATIVGVWLCGRTAAALGERDPSAIVWDEFAGLWLTLFAVPAGPWWPLLGFALFRLFDIVKPWPIGWLDRRLQGGLGIMLDDILAGTFAGITLQVVIHLVG